MNPVTKWALIAVLAAVAAGYFALVAWRADILARLLLRRGFGGGNLGEPQLATRMRILGWVGLVLSAAGLFVAVARILG